MKRDTQIKGPASLQIQSVLFNNTQAHVDQALHSLARAVELGIGSGVLSEVKLVFGDCSPEPVFTDGHMTERIQQFKPQGIRRIDYEFFNKNLGSAAAHNRLLQKLCTDLVLILNPDTLVAPNLFLELIKPMQKIGTGIVEARQIPIEHPKNYDPITGETGWAATACALISSAAAREVGGFDAESFFLYCDDVDFSWRVRLAGYKVVFQPSAVVFHDKRLSTAGKWQVGKAEEYYSAEAALFLAHKYSRNRLVKRIESQLLAKGSALEKKAARAFQKRRLEKKLPPQIDPTHTVSQFIKGFYAPHRF